MAKVNIPTAMDTDVQAAPKGQLNVRSLLLDQIELDPITDVRLGPKAKDEALKIDQLAKSIFEQGQLQPILVRPNGSEGKYRLIAGRRRYAAVQLIQELKASGKYPEIGDGPITIDAVVTDKDDEQAWLASIQENLQRKQFSPIEIAKNMVEIRKRKGWDDAEDWSKHVADFLHVSRATVTETVKLLDLPGKIQRMVHTGELSPASAKDLAAVEESRRDEVLAKAEELADIEEASKPKKAAKPAAVPAKGKAKDAEEPEEEKGKIKRKHVIEAAREANALTTVKARSRGEIIAFFQTFLDSTDPYPQPMVDFCKTFIEKWATGKSGDRALMNKWDVIAELIADKQPKQRKTA